MLAEILVAWFIISHVIMWVGIIYTLIKGEI